MSEIRVTSPDLVATIPGHQLGHEEPTRGKASRMTRRKRQYGSGCVLHTERGLAIRWREPEIAPDGTTRRVLRYETLGGVSRKQAAQTLAQRLARATNPKTPTRSRITFRTLAGQWDNSVLPMYKHSTK